MPSILRFMGYNIYFWSNENNEPVHVHVSKGKMRGNATKIWITSSGDALLESNGSRINSSELNKILLYVHSNANFIVNSWNSRFNYIRYIV